MAAGSDSEAVDALEIGTLEDASAAVARLLAVTEATMGRRAQLQGALESRVAIEQAKGIVAERHGLDVDDAFDVLRQAARANRVKLHDLVRRVRPGEPDPPELVATLSKRRGDV
jgi:AmiR/NasT family two-component response regulator